MRRGWALPESLPIAPHITYAAGSVRDSQAKVFCFFFSKKKTFLA
jgi:hypothetical protein